MDFRLKISSRVRFGIACAALVCFGAGTVYSNLSPSYVVGGKNAVLVSKDSPALTDGKTKKIIIDAGHGGIDPGAVGKDGSLEKNINLAISQDLRAMLEVSGFEVIMTREADVSIHDDGIETTREKKKSDMANRKKIIDDNLDAVFISIHQNKFTTPAQKGAQMFYTLNHGRNGELATSLQNNFKLVQPENLREPKFFDSELFLFKETKQPAVLIECGFLSNLEDEQNLNSPDYQKKIASVIFKSIVEFTK